MIETFHARGESSRLNLTIFGYVDSDISMFSTTEYLLKSLESLARIPAVYLIFLRALLENYE